MQRVPGALSQMVKGKEGCGEEALCLCVAKSTDSGTAGVSPRQHGGVRIRSAVNHADALLPLPASSRPGTRWSGQVRLWGLSQREGQPYWSLNFIAALWLNSHTPAAMRLQQCEQLIMGEWTTACEHCDWCRLIPSVPPDRIQRVYKDMSLNLRFLLCWWLKLCLQLIQSHLPRLYFYFPH